MAQEKPKYTTILHSVRIELDLSCNEYCVADIIYHLSSNPSAKIQGWCYASRETIGEYIGLDKRNVYRIIDRLIDIGIIEKDSDTKWLKTTAKWYDNVVIERIKYDGDKKSSMVTKSHQGYDKKSSRTVTKSHQGYDKKSHNIYIDNNNDIYNNNLEKLKLNYPEAYQRIIDNNNEPIKTRT